MISSSSLNKQFNKRALFLLVILYLIGFSILARLFFLGVINHDFYSSKLIQQEYLSSQKIFKRGEIYLQNGGELLPAAINKDWPMAYAEPNRISSKNISNLAQKVATILNLTQKDVLNKISNPKDPFELLKRRLSDDEANLILKINDPGIKIKKEKIRYYPGENLAAHILGFLGYHNNKRIGQYGVEEYYQNYLSGNEDPSNNGHSKGLNNTFSEENDLILTIDSNIQLFIEEELERIINLYDATGGSIIIMNPSTGAIMAMANYPDFNPNNYAKEKNFSNFMNNSISAVFEPGSVFKPILMSIAIDQGIVTPATTYTDKGFVKIGGYTIYNADKKTFGLQTMTDVIKKSLNTGIVYAQSLLKKDTIREYFKKFGLYEKTNIDLSCETQGSMANLNTNREINFATASFGQGISMTPIQLIRAIGVIANKGRIVTPHVVETIINDGSIQTEDISNKTKDKRVISEQSADRLVAMMVAVTEDGTGKNARIPGYWIATKTGTAQIPSSAQRGYSNETIHTVVGFAPAYNPRFVILVKLDKPQKGRFAATTVTPVFRNISEYILNYLEIPPKR